MKRWNIINKIIEDNNYHDYLEIGVRNGDNFNRIKCDRKHGVDPRGNPTHRMTSNEFFIKISRNKKYDIIFIDGLHEEKQVLEDIYNSLEHLKDGGTIVVHDCNPQTKIAQDVPRKQKLWNGTVWKAFVFLKCTEPNLKMYVVDKDHGCGIIKKGSQKLYVNAPLKECLTWKYFKEHKKEMLNLVDKYE